MPSRVLRFEATRYGVTRSASGGAKAQGNSTDRCDVANSAHQHVSELPGIARVDVFRAQSRAIGERGPVGIKPLHRAEIRELDFEAALKIHLIGFHDSRH